MFNCLATSDLRKLTDNLTNQSERTAESHSDIRKASMRFICLLVGQQQELKGKFLEAMGVTMDVGYVFTELS